MSSFRNEQVNESASEALATPTLTGVSTIRGSHLDSCVSTGASTTVNNNFAAHQGVIAGGKQDKRHIRGFCSHCQVPVYRRGVFHHTKGDCPFVQSILRQMVFYTFCYVNRRATGKLVKATPRFALPNGRFMPITQAVKSAMPEKCSLLKIKSRQRHWRKQSPRSELFRATFPAVPVSPGQQKTNLIVLSEAIKNIRLSCVSQLALSLRAHPKVSSLRHDSALKLKLSQQSASLREEISRCSVALNSLPDQSFSPQIEKITSRAKVLAAMARMHNKLMHALNGNIDGIESSYVDQDASRQQTIAGEFHTAARPELGGTIPVLTEYLFGATVPSTTKVAGPRSFDKTLLQKPVSLGDPAALVIGDRAGILNTKNRYHLVYPTGSGRLPSERFDQSESIFLRNSLRSGGAPFDVASSTRAPDSKSQLTSGADYIRDVAAPIRTLWTTDPSVALAADAEKALSSHRFAGTRGNRTVLGWESQASNRISYFRNLAAVDAEGQSYYRMMYHLWSDYFTASLDESVSNNNLGPLQLTHAMAAGDLNYDLNGQHVTNQVRLQTMGARILPPNAPGQAPPNPEDFLANPNDGPDHIAAIADGTTAFLDVEGMSPRMAQVAIKALAPRDQYFSWGYTRPDPRGPIPAPLPPRHPGVSGNPSRPGTPLPPIPRPDISLISPLQLRDELQAGESGAKTIILHYGAQTMLTQAQAEDTLLGRVAAGNVVARSPWNLRPSRSQIADVIRHFIIKHHANLDAWAALDAVLYDMVAFEPYRSPVAAANATVTGHLNCFGNLFSSSRRLPNDATMSAYFDRFRINMSMEEHAPDVLSIFSSTPTELTWTAAYMCHGAAVALNWAAFAFSMRQQEWQAVANPNLAGISQYRRNLSVQMTSRLLDTELSPWTVSLMAATALMYEFKPMPTTMLYTSQVVSPQFARNTSPFLANAYHNMWMCKVIPQHMVLPWAGAVPTWPEGPKPMYSADQTPTPRVRLARALKLFVGRAWVQDGAMAANAQFYFATPTARNTWASDLGGQTAQPPVGCGSWNSPFQYDWPANPDMFNAHWLAAPGNPFANFTTPGSIQNYDSGANRIRAVGVRMTAANDWTNDAFGKLTLAETQANVAIHYIPPVSFKVEYPPVNDFSMLVWTGTETGAYAGMSIHTGSDIATLQPPNAQTANPFPAQLANHNSPHAPQEDGTLSGFQRPTSSKRPALKPQYTPRGPIMTKLHQAKKASRQAPPATAGAGFEPKNPNDVSGAVERLARALSSTRPDSEKATKPKAPRSSRGTGRPLSGPISPTPLTREAKIRAAVALDPEVARLKEEFIQSNDDDIFFDYMNRKRDVRRILTEGLASLDPLESIPPPLPEGMTIVDTAPDEIPEHIKNDDFFRGTSRSDRPRVPPPDSGPMSNTHLPVVPPADNNDGAAFLAQSGLIPPAQPLPETGEGTNRFPTDDSSVFAQTATGVAAEALN
jgi:hypothetical protein